MTTLQDKLQTVISQLSTTARTSKLISINAALAAGRSMRGSSADGAEFRTVAEEIHRLSERSESGLAELHDVLDAVRTLSRTINLAGRQRMLSQKIMKLHLIARLEGFAHLRQEEIMLIRDFENAQAELTASPLNTAEINQGMMETKGEWQRFRQALQTDDLKQAVDANEALLLSLHQTVQRYEALSSS